MPAMKFVTAVLLVSTALVASVFAFVYAGIPNVAGRCAAFRIYVRGHGNHSFSFDRDKSQGE